MISPYYHPLLQAGGNKKCSYATPALTLHKFLSLRICQNFNDKPILFQIKKYSFTMHHMVKIRHISYGNDHCAPATAITDNDEAQHLYMLQRGSKF